jgi:flagellar basal-body rod modification protein FlgD
MSTTNTARPVSAAPTSTASLPPNNPKGTMGKNEFLKLLVAQLKHQDPLSPSNGDQMAAQLAQFSSLEQLQNINGALETQAGGQASVLAALHTSAAMGTLGKTVVAVGDQVSLPADTDPRGVEVSATIAGAGGNAVLDVLDDNGTVVGSRALGVVNGGELTVPLGDAGQGLASGRYHYAIHVVDANGNPVNVTTYTTGKVERVQQTASGPALIAGPLTIPFANVTEIRN